MRLKHWGRWVSAAVIVVVLVALRIRGRRRATSRTATSRYYLSRRSSCEGLVNTLVLAVVAQVAPIVIGIVIALMRISKNPVAQAFAAGYTWLFRGLPVLLQILLWYNLALDLPAAQWACRSPTWCSSTSARTTIMTTFVAAFLGLALNESAYMAETLDSISNLSEDLVKDNGRNTDAVLQSLKLVSRNLEGTQGDVAGIIKDSATLINDPAKRDGQIRRIVGNLATLTGVATENDKELTALFDNFVGAINVIVAFGQTFGAAVEYAGTFVPILSRLATDFGPPVFAIGDAAVPLIAGMGEQPDMMAAVAARTADLIVKHPDAKSIVQAFAVSLPLRSLVSSCAAPVANGVCRPGDASRTIAGMMGGGA